MPYELLIKSGTNINNLGKFEPTQTINSKPKETKISEVLNTSEHISKLHVMCYIQNSLKVLFKKWKIFNNIYSVLDGYIKTNFFELFNNKLNKIVGCGSLTDGFYKLEVQIMNFSEVHYLELDLKKGDKVEIKGIMQTNGNCIYIL